MIIPHGSRIISPHLQVRSGCSVYSMRRNRTVTEDLEMATRVVSRSVSSLVAGLTVRALAGVWLEQLRRGLMGERVSCKLAAGGTGTLAPGANPQFSEGEQDLSAKVSSSGWGWSIVKAAKANIPTSPSSVSVVSVASGTSGTTPADCG